MNKGGRPIKYNPVEICMTVLLTGVSHSELSRRLGCSRNTVLNAVKRLKELGYYD